MPILSWRFRLAAPLALLAAPLLAQDPFLDGWQKLRSAQQPALHLEISLAKPAFYTGELIPLKLAYSSSQPDRFVAFPGLRDRNGLRFPGDAVVVDAADGVDVLPGGGVFSGVLAGPEFLSSDPAETELLLNKWLRFFSPGTYRIYFVSQRVRAVPPGTSRDALFRLPPAAPVVSNVATLEIRAAPPDWQAEQLASALRTVDTSPPDQQRNRALEVIQYLETPAAALEMAKRVGSDDYEVTRIFSIGLANSPFRAQALPVLEARLVGPTDAIGGEFLNTIVNVAELVASGGPMRRYPDDQAGRDAAQKEATRRGVVREEKRAEYIARLTAAAAQKEPAARALSWNTLLWEASNRHRTDAAGQAATELIGVFRYLPPNEQRFLLDRNWDALKALPVVPLLRDLWLNPPKPPANPPIDNLVLRRWYELAPDEARQVILDQIRNPTRNLRWTDLAILSDPNLPELDDHFAAGAAAGRIEDGLILRYATGAIVKQIEQAYAARRQLMARQKLPECRLPLVFYFLKYDPEYGEAELRRLLSAPSDPPACYNLGFASRDLGSYAMSPALERLAIEYLASGVVGIKAGAAELLGKLGSPTAEKPLWETLEYFRNWWKGREEELLSTNEEGRRFERVLVVALAESKAWTLDRAAFQRLQSLCSTDNCRNQVAPYLSTH